MSLNDIRKLLRIEQWYKNLLIFLPFILIENTKSLTLTSIGFIGFCCISSITYIINDWVDREKDSLHPIKKNRPLASKKINGKEAIIIATLLSIVVMTASWQLGLFYSSIILSYFIITNAYSFGLKNIPLLDIGIISFNFVLRSLAGLNTLANKNSLPYFAILFGTVLIFLSHKRRSDIKLLGEKAVKHKPVLKFYSKRNSYLTRILGYTILAPSLFQLWENGLEIEKITSLSLLLISTSILFSKKPKLVIKPHYLFKEWIWNLILGINILLLIF